MHTHHECCDPRDEEEGREEPDCHDDWQMRTLHLRPPRTRRSFKAGVRPNGKGAPRAASRSEALAAV
jgi:hypothetical protein